MSEGLRLLLVFIIVLAARFAFYQSRLWQITRLRNRYFQYLKSKEASGLWLVEQTNIFKRMLKECDVHVGRPPRIQPVGYGKVVSWHAVPEEYLSNKDVDIVSGNHDAMIKIQGHYRNERNRTISPIYWIELMVFLPREVLKVVGVGAEKPSVRIAELAWWILLAWEIQAWIMGDGSFIQLLRMLAK